jgi:ribosomal protein S18 acetylase RimI-like enzyme
VRIIGRHPAARGRGLGAATLAEALRQLVRLGATRARLEVASDNPVAIRLYERCGFQTREVTAVYRAELPREGAG